MHKKTSITLHTFLKSLEIKTFDRILLIEFILAQGECWCKHFKSPDFTLNCHEVTFIVDWLYMN